MKNIQTYNVIYACVITLLSCSLSAQTTATSGGKNTNGLQAEERLQNYQELKNLGYQDHEIFEDLGNANFLSNKYETALFWYDRLKEVRNNKLSDSYQKRYNHARKQVGSNKIEKVADSKDWVASVKSDYQTKRSSRYKDFEIQPNGELLTDNDLSAKQAYQALIGKRQSDQVGYQAPIAMTADGKTAYFSKAIYQKPAYGIFSKKEKVHKIYKATKVNGTWTDVQQVAVCPKYASAMHPSVSKDGRRLFFASNMPGTFGEYDIYVATIGKNGSIGTAKNLGTKVNTEKNDLYPNVAAGNTLFFASEGRNGYGGLDVYMAEVGHKSVAWSANLGSDINSEEDDFSVILQKGNGKGYVMSNRGRNKNSVGRVAFSFRSKKHMSEKSREYQVLEALNNDEQIDYSSTIFEDE